jgi:predicted nuclease of restriction endonuclease-like (RecB) superfamily
MRRHPLPDSYPALLQHLKQRIRDAQLRASVSINRELVLLYWRIGRDILDRQEREHWGAKVIDRLAADLKKAFPEMKGFSPRNLKYMRAFAEAWLQEQIMQQVAAQIPWFHNCVLLDKLQRQEDRLWYARAAIEHGWSRNVLVHHIEIALHKRAGAAVSNFGRTLPPRNPILPSRLRKTLIRSTP